MLFGKSNPVFLGKEGRMDGKMSRDGPFFAFSSVETTLTDTRRIDLR